MNSTVVEPNESILMKNSIPRILLVEDEKGIREALKMNLELEGYEVVTATNGTDALKRFNDQRFNLVMLDIMMPEMSGIEVCEQIRLENRDVPIVFLTAKDSRNDVVEGLRKGADDYIVKPFNLEEMLLRVKALIKRSWSDSEKTQRLETFTFGNNEVNFKTFQAKGVRGPFIISKREAKLLRLFAEKEGEVVSRKQILQYVWGYDVFPSTRTIDNFILNFRKYFEKDPKKPKHFFAVRSVGYRFLAS
jgi:two-component system alkaline phosphatase synthesis response regulator PhoP